MGKTQFGLFGGNLASLRLQIYVIFTAKYFYFALKMLFLCSRNQFKMFLLKNKFVEKIFFRPQFENVFCRPGCPLAGPAGEAKMAKNVITRTSNPS